METTLLHRSAYSVPAGALDTWLVVACALAVGVVLGVLAIGLAQYYHERGNPNMNATQLAFDMATPAPAVVVVDVAPTGRQVATPEAPKRTLPADRCPLCRRGHLVDGACDVCGMEVDL